MAENGNGEHVTEGWRERSAVFGTCKGKAGTFRDAARAKKKLLHATRNKHPKKKRRIITGPLSCFRSVGGA
jgi:hypothetical protein